MERKKKKTVLVITGPTASGKSALAHFLAGITDAEIVSADSRQLYRGMDIGTAKPSPLMLRETRYHFIDEKEIGEEYSAGAYAKDALARIRSIHAKKRPAIVTGGSTLYIQGLLHGFSELPGKNPEIRERLVRELREKGARALYDRLASLDPVQAATFDPSKSQRLLRSLEIIAATGKTVTELCSPIPQTPDAFEFIPIGLALERKELYSRINRRTDEMMTAGLLDEARALFDRHLKGKERCRINALETVGYKELFDFFRGETSLFSATELIKQHTRNYAKRQLTFFRNRMSIEWIEAPINAAGIERLAAKLKKRLFEN
ncbi:tRNA (adenosine(37)-N6)-dimethylallyltransferase MiaA [Prosthecochloris sp. GSB1]|uniref:tRNA (adenosine(37)-N6)-dimethylallyltransferase MiaA n=1 Tax=Prosthecochloris sp. GSB1 TaxID=281093 RepID=UPI000B8C8118|nr:tRNA (adenosine(37)-N6)-dimethylallyltransferase MiaA [Prosthecochloris sp. GSB1]ASQ90310.1 tRNA (adenosine(37)-N6)-dimethylallyltransferase MiaA [Prosthecochloris sp. GSB1]